MKLNVARGLKRLFMIGAILWALVCAGFFYDLTRSAPAEVVFLRNGAKLNVDRHEDLNARVRLYQSGGYIELSHDEVLRVEPGWQESIPQVAALFFVPIILVYAFGAGLYWAVKGFRHTITP